LRKHSNIKLQLVIWISIWLMIIFVGNVPERSFSFYGISLIRILKLAMFFNVAYYWLLPFYFGGQRRTFLYLSLIVFPCLVAISAMVEYYVCFPFDDLRRALRENLLSRSGSPLLIFTVPQFIIGITMFGVAAAVKSFSAIESKNQAVQAANRRKLEAELALLKSQINPHFLLNTLNNIYALSLLSEMMKYILNECTQDKVSLQSDISFIENYLSLQKLRLAPNVGLTISLPNNVPPNLFIEPMVLITFIENSFKHGITTVKECDIGISITLEDNRLKLFVKNNIVGRDTNQTDNSGMGLENTEKRLEHRYPSSHSLIIDSTDDFYQVNLTIDL